MTAPVAGFSMASCSPESPLDARLAVSRKGLPETCAILLMGRSLASIDWLCGMRLPCVPMNDVLDRSTRQRPEPPHRPTHRPEGEGLDVGRNVEPFLECGLQEQVPGRERGPEPQSTCR